MKYTNIIFILVSTLLILECVDITTTTLLLIYKGIICYGSELNPFANPNSSIQFVFKMVFPIFLGILALLPVITKPKNQTKNELKSFKRLMIIIFIILIIFYMIVVINNIYWLNVQMRFYSS